MRPPHNERYRAFEGLASGGRIVLDTLSAAEVQRALGGDSTALASLVRGLTPVIQGRVARALLARRSGWAAGRSVRQEVEDLTQEIFLQLFAEDGKILRSWQPERGLSLGGFVALVTERQTVSILRTGKRNPWKEEPTLVEDLDRPATDGGPEAATASREELRLLLERLAEELTPLGRQLFDLLFVRELGQEEVQRRTGLSADAVYAWRSRLRRLAGRLYGEISEMPGEKRTSPQGWA